MSNKYIFILGVLVIAAAAFYYGVSRKQSINETPVDLTKIDLKAITVTNKDNDVSVVLDKAEYTKGMAVAITVKNNTSRAKDVVSPLYNVERYDGTKWVMVQRLDCPCGAQCKIPAFIRLEAGLSTTYSWNQKEEWCKDETKSSLVSNHAIPGAYRAKIVIAEKDEADKGKEVTYYSGVFLVR